MKKTRRKKYWIKKLQNGNYILVRTTTGNFAGREHKTLEGVQRSADMSNKLSHYAK